MDGAIWGRKCVKEGYEVRRLVLAVFALLVLLALVGVGRELIVTTTADSGRGSLRWALLMARPGDVIKFDPTVFPPDEPATIYPRSELPHIHCGNLTIDASNAGVVLDGSKARGEWVIGLGVDSDWNTIQGLQIVNFSGAGIFLTGRHNMIGGNRSIGKGPLGQGNLLSGNSDGIGIAGGSGTSYNTITGNLIGTDVSGKNAWGNRYTGIFIEEGANSNTVGPNNIIAYNGCGGIEIRSPDSFGNTISRNSIHDNEGMGISLQARSNSGLSAPFIFDFNLETGKVTGGACANCIIEIFSDADNEGKIYEGRVNADHTGAFSFDKGTSFIGPHITATATDCAGNTSEFSTPTSGVKRTLTVQHGTNLPKIIQLPKESRELVDNRIGTHWYVNLWPPELRREQWAEISHDINSLGIKWIRLSIDHFDWEMVDWEGGDYSKMAVDPFVDAAVDELIEHGIEIVYCLTFWDSEGRGQQREPGYSRFEREDEILRYLEYVQFIVRHFHNRIRWYEILNEPNIGDGTQQYVRVANYINLVRRVAPLIRSEYPGARIVVGAVSMPERGAQEYLRAIVESDVMPLVDGVSWHPGGGLSPALRWSEGCPFPPTYNAAAYYQYPSLVREIKELATLHGFEGEFMAEEMNWRTPRTQEISEPWTYSEIQSAKYYARGIVMHLGLDVHSGLIVHELRADVPETALIRNLCTVMAGHEAIDIAVDIDIDYDGPVAYCAFRYPNDDRMLAVWTDAVAQDEDPGVPATITIPGLKAETVTGIDVLHGFEQELVFEIGADSTIVRDLLVKDYPILIRLSNPIISESYKETVGDGFHRLGNVDAVPNTSGDKSDRDGDGVPDDQDYCPDWPGSKEMNGC